MQTQFATLAKSMEAARTGGSVTSNASAYTQQLAQVTKLRDGIKEVTDAHGKITQAAVPGFNQLMQATGAWNVQTVKAVTSSQALTKSLMDGKLQMNQLTQGYGKFMTTLRQVANEQQKLRNSTAIQWTQSSNGKSMVDLYTPTSAITSAGVRIGTYMTALKSAGQAVQDWGKNTQWAGRQITAGLVMPVALASAGLVKLADDADKQLTRITKVMNTPQVSDNPWAQQAADVQAYAATRNAAMQTGIDMAKQYGAALTDTLGLEADLAAIGLQGNQLQTVTSQVTRFATLGEIDYNTALQTTISLMNAYKMTTTQLGDAFNYMNQLENDTSLSMKDFATAIPIASNAMAQLGVSFKDFGTLMVAGKAGGVDSTQMAQSLKSATARILTPTKATAKAFDEIGIDINKEVGQSNANLMKLLEDLGPKMAGADPIKRMTAIKQLFGTYQYGKQSTVMSNLLDAMANPDDSSNQTAVAIKTAQKTNDQNKQVADAEIKQFQQSASGKLTIAVATMKAQLTELGAPLLNVVTPIVHGLTGIATAAEHLVKILGGLPGPVKKVLEFLGAGALVTGPLMMMIGIFANFGGTIAKFIASLKLAGKGFQIFDAEMAADEQLQKTALQTKDKSAQATANLALRMKELVDIMQTRMEAQAKLNSMIEDGVKAEADAALASEKNASAQLESASASGKNAVAQKEVAVAEEQVTAAAQIEAVSVQDTIALLSKLTAAAVAARTEVGLNYPENSFLGRMERLQRTAPLAIEAGPSAERAPKGSLWAGQFVPRKDAAAASNAVRARLEEINANMVDANGYPAALGYGPADRAISGTQGRGFNVPTVGSLQTTVGLKGPSGVQNSRKQAEKFMADQERWIQDGYNTLARDAAARQEMLFKDLSLGPSYVGQSGKGVNLNPYNAGKYGNSTEYLGSPAEYHTSLRGGNVSLGSAEALAAQQAAASIVTTTERTLMDDLVAMSESQTTGAMGMRAKMAAVAERLNPMNSLRSSIMLNNASQGGVGAMRNVQGGITEEGVSNSAAVAKNAEKTSASWGKVAGNVGMLAMGAMMVSSMADGSGSIATNLMQGALAFSMIAPVIGNAVKKMQELRAANAALAAEGAAGTSLIGSGFKKIGEVGKSVFTAIGNTAKFLFTTGPGILISLALAVAGAFMIINNEMTKALRTQENINKSATTWQQIIGYTSKNTIQTDGTIAKGGNAYLARANAVKQLGESNQSLVDSMVAAKSAANGMDKVYDMALNEALKVKVDGGSATQAKMAFDVALQAADLGQAEIDQLNIKYNKINLDDPQQLKEQLNNQIQSALAPQDNQDAQGGWLEQHWNNFFGQKSSGSLGRLFGGDGYSGLSDDAKAASSKAGQAVYDAIAEGLQEGDSGQIKTATDHMNDAINKQFNDGFTRLRADGGNAAIFKDLGITTMTQLRDKWMEAVDAQKKGIATETQNKLVGAMSDIQKSDAWQGFQDSWKGMVRAIGQADGKSGPALDDFVNKMMNSKAVQDQFTNSIDTGAIATKKLGDSFQQAADGAASLADAMNTDGAIATGAQYAQEMQSAYSGTIQSYVQAMNTAWQNAQQAKQKSIQDAGDAEVKALQDQQKAQDKAYDNQDKAITQHYKDLGKQYDANVKAKQDEAKAETDAIQKQQDALKKDDTTRQDLFNKEMTRLQRLAAAQSNNIDFNAALNSGNLDEAARIYANNQATSQQNMLDDQQKAMDATSQAQQDAMSQQISNINDARDAYVQAQQDMKDALSDREQAEHDSLATQKTNYDDAMQAQITASQTATQAAIASQQSRAANDKAALDQQLKAQTAFAPQSVAQTQTQINQVDGIYAQYGVTLQNYGVGYSHIVADAFRDNIKEASNKLQSDIAWAQIGKWIQDQLDAGANFTLDDALQFLKTGVWPTGLNGMVGGQGVDLGTAKNNINYGGGPSYNVPAGGWAHKAHGGEVPGARYTGPGTKFQPAGIVHAGEYVFPQEAVQRIGLNALNHLAFSPQAKNGIIPGYADGGYVPSFASGFAAVKYAALQGAVMRAAAQKMMDTAVLEHSYGDVAGLVAGAGGATKGGQTWQALDKIRQQLFPGSVLTDWLRPGAHDMHGAGQAIDIGWPGNTQAGLMPIAARLAAMFPGSTELIHNPNGSIKNGRPVSPGFWGAKTWSEHANHVHWGMTPEALAQAGMGNLMAGAAAAPTDVVGNQAIVKNLAAQRYGWQGAEWNALYALIQKESGFRNTAQNPTSSAYGMFQFLNDTWANYGIAKTADPTQQTLGGLKYIATRYNDPLGAWAHELNYNWYDQGGWLKNGQVGINQSGKPEPVFTDAQWSIMKSLVGTSVNSIGLNAAGIDSESRKAYNIEKVEIDMTGSMINGQVDFEQGVYNALVKLDDKMGRSRTVS